MKLSQTKISFIACIVIVCYFLQGDGNTIGVSNGKMGDNLPPEEQVVTLLKKNNIGKYRMYNKDVSSFKAFANSGIEIIVGILNDDLESISSSQDVANKWVQDNIVPYYTATSFKYIAVGQSGLQDLKYQQFVLGAITRTQMALQNANLNIKVTTIHDAKAITNTTSPPSKATFSDSVKDNMTSLLQFLQEQGSPFMAYLYPHRSVESRASSLDDALFESTSPVMRDGNLIYMNLFDAMVDRFYGAMEALGYSTIPVIAETGWPSKGSDVATMENARTYHNNLIKHVLSNAGTPKRPGRNVETYLFALFNENEKPGDETERHYGLFYPNKTSVYSMNFSPQFKDTLPVDFIPRVTSLLYIDM